jgi:O-succinylbenzoate synthase
VAGLPWQDIEYIEEPLREPRQLAEFARSTGAPLALDETLVEAERAAEEIGSAPARPADEDPVILPAPWKAPDGEGSHSTLPPTRRKPPALDLSGFQAVVMKPTLIGGIGRCMSILHQAKDSGVVPVISSSFESGVGTQMLAALAAAAADTACGLDPYRWLAEDLLADPLRLVRGRLWFNCRASGPARVKVQYLQELADDDNTVSP